MTQYPKKSAAKIRRASTTVTVVRLVATRKTEDARRLNREGRL